MSSKRSVDLRLVHAEDRRVQVDVLAPGEVGVEARADLDQPGDAAAGEHLPLYRVRAPRDQLEQGRLARAVVAEDGDGLALAAP